MKLLLTSKGITNKSIAAEFERLIGKKYADSRIAYVTTGGHMGGGDKRWFVDEMLSVRALDPGYFDVLEFNTIRREEILERLDAADALFFSGGNTAAWMNAIDSNDLRDILRDFAKNKVYAGISAGSHIASPDLKLSTQKKVEAYAVEYGYRAESALKLIDFYIRSHYLSSDFPHLTPEYVEKLAAEIGNTIYAIDDQSAVSIEGSGTDQKVKVISEGKWDLFTG